MGTAFSSTDERKCTMDQKKLILFTDIGDTVIDEGTEIRDVPGGVVKCAECLPGARETMLRLYEAGYMIVMVADGLEQSFRNTMKQHGLTHIFSAWSVSELVGCEKPCAAMFQTAMDRAGLKGDDKQRIIMVGNNIHKDIAGANRFGIRSVLMAWSPRYQYEPSNPEEVPDFRLDCPEQLYELAEKLEEQEK